MEQGPVRVWLLGPATQPVSEAGEPGMRPLHAPAAGRLPALLGPSLFPARADGDPIAQRTRALPPLGRGVARLPAQGRLATSLGPRLPRALARPRLGRLRGLAQRRGG